MEEVNVKIENADPDKTIKVGSFRVDSKGNQKLADVNDDIKISAFLTAILFGLIEL